MIELTLNLHFQSKFEAGFLLVPAKLIKLDPDLIEKFEIDRNRSKIYQKLSNLIEKVNIN